METKENKMPVGLRVFGIFTLITTGFGTLGGLLTLGSGSNTSKALDGQQVLLMEQSKELAKLDLDFFSKLFEKFARLFGLYNDQFFLFSGLNLIESVLGLIGIVLMWKKRKIGFHFYVGYCLMNLFIPYVFASFSEVPLFVLVSGIIINGIFILIYSRFFRWFTL